MRSSCFFLPVRSACCVLRKGAFPTQYALRSTKPFSRAMRSSNYDHPSAKSMATGLNRMVPLYSALIGVYCCGVMISVQGFAQEASVPAIQPHQSTNILFANEDVLELTLTADLRAVFRDVGTTVPTAKPRSPTATTTVALFRWICESGQGATSAAFNSTARCRRCASTLRSRTPSTRFLPDRETSNWSHIVETPTRMSSGSFRSI